LRNTFTSLLEAGSDAAWLLVTAALIFSGSQDINTFVYGRGLVLLASVMLALAILFKLIGLRAGREMVGKALKEAFPFASSEFLAWASMRGDVIIIGFILGGYAAGIYSPAVGVVNGLFLVPAAVYMVMVPVLSNLYAHHPNQARTSARRMVLLLALTGAILSAGFFIGAPVLISFLSESFQESLGIMRILSVILLLKSGSFAMAAILVATGQQSGRTKVQAITVFLNISLNLLVVSRYGISGVAVVYVVTETVLLAGYAWLVYQQRVEPTERRPVLSGWKK
jgi:O-antigen/teichoic acid export membrane protein